MNTHKNVRLTFVRRMELVRMIADQRLSKVDAAREAGVSAPTAKKWLGRYLAEGEAGLMDRSSRPRLSPRTIAPAKALALGASEDALARSRQGLSQQGIRRKAQRPKHRTAHRQSKGGLHLVWMVVRPDMKVMRPASVSESASKRSSAG